MMWRIKQLVSFHPSSVLILKGLNLSLDGSQGSHTQNDHCIPRTTLIEVVRRCLHVADPENREFLGSALLVAKMSGDSHLNERIQKLFLLTSLFSKHSGDDLSDVITEELNNQDQYFIQAAHKLEMLKLRKLGKSYVSKIEDPNAENGNIWTLAKSWNPCPIGMLPREVGPSGYLPVLEYGMDSETKTDMPFIEDKEKSEPTHCNQSDASCDMETAGDTTVKRMTVTEEFDFPQQDDTNVVLISEGVKGRLLIDGFYLKVGDQESRYIQSRLRILVATKKL